MSELAPDVPCEQLGYNIMLEKNGRIISRGGKSSLVGIDWQRILDQTSVSSVEIFTPCAEACGELALADHWNTKLSITHNDIVVWAGPVSKVRYFNNRVIIDGRDNFAFATKRRIKADTDHVSTDVAQIAADYWASWVTNIGPPLAEDTPWDILFRVDSKTTQVASHNQPSFKPSLN
jgi:hypothetical protein